MYKTQLPINDIIKSYQDKPNISNIAKEYNSYYCAIKQILIDNNIPIIIVPKKLWKNFKGYEDVPASFISNMKANAKQFKTTCNITCKEVYDLFLLQNKKCFYSDIDISFADNTATFLKIHKNDTYNIKNIVLVSLKVKYMSQYQTIDNFMKWCKLISNKKDIGGNQITLITTRKNSKKYKNIHGGVWHEIVRGALRRNIDFSLTIEEAWEQYEKQNGCCNITGIPILFAEKSHDYLGRTASLDRINSKAGYNKDNIQWVHKEINEMKHILTQREFIETATLVTGYYDRN